MNPTVARPTISSISVTPARANLSCSVRMCATTYPTKALTTMAMPPIVGVPAFAMCGCLNGPSSRIVWPISRARRTRIRKGVPNTLSRNATDAASSSAIMHRPPR